MKEKNIFLSIIMFFVYFINIPPAYIVLNEKISTLIEIIQVIIFLVVVLLYMSYSKKRGLSTIIILIVLFWGIYIFSTVVHSGNIGAAIKPLINTFSLCAIFEMCKEKNLNFINTGLTYFGIIIFINLVTIILFPKGLYLVYGNINEHFFLGHRNNSIEYIIPAICFANLVNYESDVKFSLKNIIILGMSITTVLLTWSANAILVMAFIVFSLYLPTKKTIQKVINCQRFFIIYMAAFVGIIIYRLQYYFSWLIVDILHKSLDFTYRTYIWDKSIYWIKKSLLIGYGYESPLLKTIKITHPNSCHNYILDFMYMGGIIMVGILIIILITIFKKLKNSKSYASKILTITICSYFILWFATPIHKDVLSIMFLIFTIAYNIKYFEEGAINETNKKNN